MLEDCVGISIPFSISDKDLESGDFFLSEGNFHTFILCNNANVIFTLNLSTIPLETRKFVGVGKFPIPLPLGKKSEKNFGFRCFDINFHNALYLSSLFTHVPYILL